MEKLIELLNEWERERVNHNTKEYIKRGKNSFTSVGIIEVISKHYGFIKWLVDNDKIDRDKVLISFSMTERDGLGNYYGHGVEGYQRILMLLAIQDEPIDYLISVLK